MSSYMILSVYEFIYEYVFPWDVKSLNKKRFSEKPQEKKLRAS